MCQLRQSGQGFLVIGLTVCLHCFSYQVLASYINPAGSSSCQSAEACSAESRASNSSALPAVLQELLCQSCLIPAMSSYLRNDSGRLHDFTNEGQDTQSKREYFDTR